MTRKKIILLSITILVVGFGLGALLFKEQIMAVWRAPLGPSLDLPTYTPTSQRPTATIQPSTAQTKLTPVPTSTVLVEDTATPIIETKCGGPPVMILLGIGSDVRGNNYMYGLSDVMRIVRVDFVTPSVTILEFPRDLYVEIPDISEHYGITHGKLNQAYLYGLPGLEYYDGPGGGPGLLARTLDLNFGLRVDNYGAVNMKTFINIVDAVGGIDVFIAREINGNAPDTKKPKDELIFPYGRHHLDGSRALMLARLRPEGVFERANNQNLVLCALREKLLRPEVVGDIPELIRSFKGSVLMDLSPEQLAQLACLAPQINGNNLSFANFPEELFTGTRVNDPMIGYTFIWDADFNVLRDYIARFVDGTWPEKVASAPADVTPTPGKDSSFCP